MNWDAAARGVTPPFDGTTGVQALDDLVGCPPTARLHAEGDVARHTELVADAASEVLDARNDTGRDAQVVRLAARHGARLDAVLIDTAVEECVARQRNRPLGTAVPGHAVRSMAAKLRCRPLTSTTR